MYLSAEAKKNVTFEVLIIPDLNGGVLEEWRVKTGSV